MWSTGGAAAVPRFGRTAPGPHRSEGPPLRPGLSPARFPAATLLLVVVLWAGGCAPAEPDRPPPADSTYVRVMARLTVLDGRRNEPGLDEGRLDAARDSILSIAGVERDSLLARAREIGNDPARARIVWSAIERIADSLRTAGWSPPGLPPPPGSERDSLAAPAGADSSPPRSRTAGTPPG